MPLDADKILEFFGSKATTEEELFKEVQSKFFTEEQIFKDPEVKKRISGRFFGSATTATKQIFEAEGVELTGDDLTQPIEAVAKLGISKLKEKWEAEKQEITKTAGLSTDEKIKEFQEALKKKDEKIRDYDELVKSKATEFEKLTSEKNNEIKGIKLGLIEESMLSSITWAPEKDAFSKKGFIADFKEKYIVDLDENGKEFIADRSSGSRIKAEGSHSTFMTPSEVFKRDALKEGLAAVNKKAGVSPQNNQRRPVNITQGGGEGGSAPVRKMANTRLVANQGKSL